MNEIANLPHAARSMQGPTPAPAVPAVPFLAFVEAQPEAAANAAPVELPPATPLRPEADAPLPTAFVAATADHTDSAADPARAAMAADYAGLGAAIAPVRLYEASSLAHGYICQLPSHTALAQAATRAPGAAAADLAPTSPRGAAGAISTAIATALAQSSVAACSTGSVAGPANDDVETAATATSAPTRNAAALEWLARRLHLTMHADGRVEVWLRDFQLEPHERDALGFEVLNRLQAEGRAVARVSVNGHQVWTAVAIEHPQENRDAR